MKAIKAIKDLPNKAYRTLIRPAGVAWSTRGKTISNTMKVVVFSVIAAVILIAADLIFGKILELLIL